MENGESGVENRVLRGKVNLLLVFEPRSDSVPRSGRSRAPIGVALRLKARSDWSRAPIGAAKRRRNKAQGDAQRALGPPAIRFPAPNGGDGKMPPRRSTTKARPRARVQADSGGARPRSIARATPVATTYAAGCRKCAASAERLLARGKKEPLMNANERQWEI